MSPSWLPCLIHRVAPNPRIQRSELVNSYQQQPVCCLVFFFLYSECISGLCALHTVHNSGFVYTLPKEQASTVQQILFLRGHDPYTLACKARPSFDGCRTSLSVSLSIVIRSAHPSYMFTQRAFSAWWSLTVTSMPRSDKYLTCNTHIFSPPMIGGIPPWLNPIHVNRRHARFDQMPPSTLSDRVHGERNASANKLLALSPLALTCLSDTSLPTSCRPAAC